MVVLRSVEITEITVYSTQVILRNCDMSLLRSKLFKTNVQCKCMVVLCFLEIT